MPGGWPGSGSGRIRTCFLVTDWVLGSYPHTTLARPPYFFSVHSEPPELLQLWFGGVSPYVSKGHVPMLPIQSAGLCRLSPTLQSYPGFGTGYVCSDANAATGMCVGVGAFSFRFPGGSAHDHSSGQEFRQRESGGLRTRIRQGWLPCPTSWTTDLHHSPDSPVRCPGCRPRRQQEP